MTLGGGIHAAAFGGIWKRHVPLLAAAASGRVLDLDGAGLGRYDPSSVTEVVVPAPGARRRRRLLARAGAAPSLRVIPTTLHGLGMTEADGSFDTVVCALLLCRSADPSGLLADVRRLLSTDGSLLLIEHITGRSPATAAAQRALTPAWSRAAGGCHLDRDTIAALRAARFVVADCERSAPWGRLSAGTVVRARAIPRLAP